MTGRFMRAEEAGRALAVPATGVAPGVRRCHPVQTPFCVYHFQVSSGRTRGTAARRHSCQSPQGERFGCQGGDDAGESTCGGARTAACRASSPDLFFPVGTVGHALTEIESAKAVCAGCAVREACLEFARAHQSGVRRVGRHLRGGAPPAASGAPQQDLPLLRPGDRSSVDGLTRHVDPCEPVHASRSSAAHGVHDRLRRHLALGRPRAAVALPVELAGRVGVGVDRHLASRLDRETQQPLAAGRGARGGS